MKDVKKNVIKKTTNIEEEENDFAKCVMNCIKKELGPDRWLEIVGKCKTDIKCYIKEAGATGLKCAASCILSENKSVVEEEKKRRTKSILSF